VNEMLDGEPRHYSKEQWLSEMKRENFPRISYVQNQQNVV
jgi:hypothetical protein